MDAINSSMSEITKKEFDDLKQQLKRLERIVTVQQNQIADLVKSRRTAKAEICSLKNQITTIRSS